MNKLLHRAFVREQHLQKAADYAQKADLHEHQASACIRAKVPSVCFYGENSLSLAQACRRLSVEHLRKAVDLTNWEDAPKDERWIQKLEAAAAEARRGEWTPAQVQHFMHNKPLIKHAA